MVHLVATILGRPATVRSLSCVGWRRWIHHLRWVPTFAELFLRIRASLSESRAICRYLEEKYKGKGPELVPNKDFRARSLYEQAVNVEAFNFEPGAMSIIREKFVKKYVRFDLRWMSGRLHVFVEQDDGSRRAWCSTSGTVARRAGQ